MTTTNHFPDPSPETDNAVSLLTVEWMPLEGLIQSWAAFAQETTSACALRALSAAFAALEQESMARSRQADYAAVDGARNRNLGLPVL